MEVSPISVSSNTQEGAHYRWFLTFETRDLGNEFVSILNIKRRAIWLLKIPPAAQTFVFLLTASCT